MIYKSIADRLRLRQIVVGEPAVEHFRFTDDIQVFIGTDGGKLRRPVERRAGAEGLVIVEQKSGLVGAILHNLFIIPGGEQPSW